MIVRRTVEHVWVNRLAAGNRDQPPNYRRVRVLIQPPHAAVEERYIGAPAMRCGCSDARGRRS